MILIGRTGIYQEWLTQDGLLRVCGWAREGLTDEQMAHNIGVSRETFYAWQRRFPDFSDAIKKGKAPVDIEVENALLKRALGYDYEETVTEIYKDGTNTERTHVRKIKKHMPPDVGAVVFWLKNRKPNRWRDKIEAPPDVANDLLQSLMDLERGADDD